MENKEIAESSYCINNTSVIKTNSSSMSKQADDNTLATTDNFEIKFPPLLDELKRQTDTSITNETRYKTRQWYAQFKLETSNIDKPVIDKSSDVTDNYLIKSETSEEKLNQNIHEERPSTSGESRNKTKTKTCKSRAHRKHTSNINHNRIKHSSSGRFQVHYWEYRHKPTRILTYIDWPKLLPTGESLADANCFYEGVVNERGAEIEDMVTCYKCGKCMYNFEPEDDPKEEHLRLHPDCSQYGRRRYSTDRRRSRERYGYGDDTGEMQSLEEDHISITESSPFGSPGNTFEELVTSNDKNNSIRPNTDRRQSRTNPHTYEGRLQSFYINRWLNTFLSAEVMAEAGFYYKGVKDEVHCSVCGMSLKGWERGDDPRQEHRNHHPKHVDCFPVN